MKKAKKEEFKYDILKIILDKFLIGVLIIIIGLYGNSILENQKQSLSFNNDLSKIQAQKIGDVWELLYIFEASTDSLIRQVATIDIETTSIEERNERIISEVTGLATKNSKLYDDLIEKTVMNRFWLGEIQYNSVKDYSALLIEYLEEYAKNNLSRIKSIDAERSIKRENIQSIRNSLLNSNI